MLLIFLVIESYSQIQRFPKPEFESGYTQPVPVKTVPRAITLEYLDVAVLFIALSLSAYFALKKRSRNYLFSLMVFSLIYFGFFRKGCVCAIGSIQNISLALFDKTYVIPLVVIAFFTLPLIFALFFGRTFCAAVCPLGAIQDVVVLKPQKLSNKLNHVLGLIPYLYLGLAVLFAATGSSFIICRYDPFIGFFRFGFNQNMFIFSTVILLLGVFIARPYCRFLCPYSVLLKWASVLSKHHVTITPDECIQCHLCADSCPFDAINTPTPEKYPGEPDKSKRQLILLLVLLPVMLVISGWSFSKLSIPLSRNHYIVKVAEQIRLEDTGQTTITTESSDAFRGTGMPTTELYNQAAHIQAQFKTGSWILGAFLAFIIMSKLINLTLWRRRIDYEPDKGTCVSCGRCFKYCPKEHERLLELKGGIFE